MNTSKNYERLVFALVIGCAIITLLYYLWHGPRVTQTIEYVTESP